MAKILNVYYDSNCLPYKDKELTVHFPLLGQTFQGGSKTTEIRFYIDNMDLGKELTWVANAKLPNGKVGTKILSRVSDIETGLDYVVLPLTNFYTQAKGDLYISLQGYDGDELDMEYDQDTGLYTLTGDPTIQATGSVKLTIAYATQLNGSATEVDTLQDILGALADKLDKNSHKYIKVVDLVNIAAEVFDNTEYNVGDILYNKRDKAFYSLVNVNSELKAQTISYIDFEGIRINNQHESTMIYQDQNGDLVFEDDNYGNTVTFNMYNNDIYINNTKVVKENVMNTALALKADKVGPLPSYSVSGGDNVIDFINSNSLNKKSFILIVGSGSAHLARFSQVTGTYYAYELEIIGGVGRWQGAEDIAGKTFNQLLATSNNSNYLPFEIEKRKVTSLSASSTNLQYPSAKCVYDAIQNSITNVYKYKGSVATYEDLPSTDLTIGDVYNVEDTGDNYAWTGTTWDKLAGTVDLSAYATKAEVQETYATKTEVQTGLGTKQDTLVGSGTGQNIKTINNESILGSGNISIQGGNAEWGQITGTLSDQTDLNNELTDIRNVANGRCKTYNLSYQDTIAKVKTRISGTPAGRVYLWNSWTNLSNNLSELSEHDITTEVNNGDYDSVVIQNPIFNSSSDYIDLKQGVTTEEDAYIIIQWGYHDVILLKSVYVNNFRAFNNGDNLYILESNVPDRWSNGYERAYKFEVDTSHLVTTDTTQDITGQKTSKVMQLYEDGIAVLNTDATYNYKIYNNASSDFIIARTTDLENFTTLFYMTNGGTIYARQILPETNNGYDLGATSRYWKDLYLNGAIYIGTGNISYANNNITINLNGTNRYLYTSESFQPQGSVNSNRINLGASNRLWKDLYLAGNISDGTNSVSVDDISNGLFNVINANDIVNNTLTQAQYDLITNGKPTRVIGGLGGYAYTLLMPPTDRNGTDANMYGIAICQSNGQSCQYMPYKIVKSTLVISLSTTIGVDYEVDELRLLNLKRVNGKTIPAYPSSTGTYVLKCVDGTLTWVQEV